MSDVLQFAKMHGAGNDFVVLDAIRHDLPADMTAVSARISDRHSGIGCDQILVVREATNPDADFRMEIYNADGSQVEMCANGIRCFYKYLRDHGHTEADEIGVETLSGVVRPRWAGHDRVIVDMGPPVLAPAEIPTTLGTGNGPVLDVRLDVPTELAPEGFILVSSVSIGNPHAVIVVEDVDAAPVHALGAFVETCDAFPNRVNVEFIQIESRSRIKQRTWERGTGETLACGSGACAVGVTSMLRDAIDEDVEIVLRGGELGIAWKGGDQSIFMTGPAAAVFEGEFKL